MVNSQSKPLKQATIGLYEACTSEGLFRGFGLSSLHQDNSINHNYAGANINNGSGTIISGNAQVTNSLNTNTSSGASAKNSNTANWGPRNENDDRAMVECSNEACFYNRWFHFECLYLDSTWVPPKNWYCRRCTAKK